MKTLRTGMKGEEVGILSKFLGVDCTDKYSNILIDCVKNFQREHNLQVDGIVGPCTWLELYLSYRGESKDITKEDYNWIAKIFDIEPESLEAVKKVESEDSTGFLSSGRPVILFEAHVFWKELKKLGKNPANYLKGNESILSSTWNKSLYRGGEKEWNRLERAQSISQEAALCSASWGMFQVMGGNWKKCGAESVFDLVARMKESQFSQFMLTVNFLRKSNLFKYLRNLDWEGFARSYNGKEYKENSYDTKLQKEYNRLKNKKK